MDFITNITLRKSISAQQAGEINLPYFKSELLLSFEEIGFKVVVSRYFGIPIYDLHQAPLGLFVLEYPGPKVRSPGLGLRITHFVTHIISTLRGLIIKWANFSRNQRNRLYGRAA